jgi:AraC-like DNA-binding protein
MAPRPRAAGTPTLRQGTPPAGPVDSYPWSSHSDIRVNAEGRFTLSFPDSLPLLLKFYQFSQAYRLAPNNHDFFEISYIQQGRGTLVVDTRSFPLREGDTFIMGDSEFHTVLAAGGAPALRAISIAFLPGLVFEASRADFPLEYLGPFYRTGRDFANVIARDQPSLGSLPGLIRRLHEELQAQGPFFALAARNCLLEMLLLIARHYDLRSTDLGLYNRRRSEIERLKNAFAYIENHGEETITLEQVASAACMSQSYFCKVFKRVTGHTLKEYILRLRIDRARQLLLLRDLPISEIALRTGFASLGYFDRVFRRIAGCSPHSWRAQSQQP